MAKIREEDKARLYELEDTIGYKFRDITHLYQALIHRSYINEVVDRGMEDNERYEFMGDAVLEFIATKYLFEKYPDDPEGMLTTKRSCIVDRANCARIARKFHLADFIFLGKGESQEGKGIKRSILSNAFEALVSAVYFDGGMEKCEAFVIAAIEKYTPDIERQSSRNFKAELQNYVQRKYQKVPAYRVVSAVGPDHAKTFEVTALVNGKPYGKGKGPSKKTAQQKAARNALKKIKKEKETGKARR